MLFYQLSDMGVHEQSAIIEDDSLRNSKGTDDIDEDEVGYSSPCGSLRATDSTHLV